MEIGRRRLLQVGVAGAALLAVGGVGLSLQQSVMRVPGRPLVALDERGFSILAAVAEVVCPGGDGLPTAAEVEVAEGVDELLGAMAPGVAEELGQALGLLENAVAGVILDGRARPFTAASAEARSRSLDAWRTSRLHVRRAAYKALVGLCNLVYWGHPATFAHVGYPGPPDYRHLLQETP